MKYEKWLEELATNKLSPAKKDKTTTPLDEVDKLLYGNLDEEEFFANTDRDALKKNNNKKSSD